MYLCTRYIYIFICPLFLFYQSSYLRLAVRASGWCGVVAPSAEQDTLDDASASQRNNRNSRPSLAGEAQHTEQGKVPRVGRSSQPHDTEHSLGTYLIKVPSIPR
jgi:hypothetical protein